MNLIVYITTQAGNTNFEVVYIGGLLPKVTIQKLMSRLPPGQNWSSKEISLGTLSVPKFRSSHTRDSEFLGGFSFHFKRPLTFLSKQVTTLKNKSIPIPCGMKNPFQLIEYSSNYKRNFYLYNLKKRRVVAPLFVFLSILAPLIKFKTIFIFSVLLTLDFVEVVVMVQSGMIRPLCFGQNLFESNLWLILKINSKSI